MATRASHNKNNSAIKRIMQEARELATDPSTDYSAAPLEEDIFEWHCTLRGPPGTEFEGGLYHFRILLPAEYPFRPPSIMMLTPNGRFELNSKICISFTNYHEELWQPAWGVRTAIIGLQGFFPLKGQAAVGVGSMEAPASERRRLAKLSRDWVCPHCKVSNLVCLPDPQISDAQAGGANNTGEHAQTPQDSSKITSSPQASTEAGGRATASAPQSDQQSALAPTIASSPGSNLAELPTQERHPQSSGNSDSPREGACSSGESTSSGAVSQPGTRTSQRTPSDLAGLGLDVTSAESARTYMGTTSARTSMPPPRPPILLDAAIGVLLVLVAALICRKIS